MDHTRLCLDLEAFETLGQVFRWTQSLTPAAEFRDVVFQDEYTRDVIVRIDDRSYAVFGATCLGAVLGVTLWDHEPTADELLSHRLASGWLPTPTATRDGQVVLGYAAKAHGRRRPALSLS
jgi:hypothetical protein